MDYTLLITITIALVLGHVGLAGDHLFRVGPLQYLLHRFYAIIEPVLLRITDFLITKQAVTGTRPGRLLLRFAALASHYLPHGLIITTPAAERFVDYIDRIEGPRGARLAVGPCVCQRALGRWKEPSCKDITVLYGADIYLHLKLGYRIITPGETKEILRECRDAGLVHSLDFCMQSGRWAFVICNCDTEVCVLTRTYFIVKKFLYPGPEIVEVNRDLCLGESRCGACVNSCVFGAIRATGSIPYTDLSKCMGCGQCIRGCRGSSRTMVKREDFRHRWLMPSVFP
jgi:ferredoxin